MECSRGVLKRKHERDAYTKEWSGSARSIVVGMMSIPRAVCFPSFPQVPIQMYSRSRSRFGNRRAADFFFAEWLARSLLHHIVRVQCRYTCSDLLRLLHTWRHDDQTAAFSEWSRPLRCVSLLYDATTVLMVMVMVMIPLFTQGEYRFEFTTRVTCTPGLCTCYQKPAAGLH